MGERGRDVCMGGWMNGGRDVHYAYKILWS